MSSIGSITIDGREYAFDDLELGELEWLEEFIGKPLTDLNNLSTVKASVGMIYIVRHRENPEFTLEDARKTKMTAIFSQDEPEPAAKKRPPKPAAR